MRLITNTQCGRPQKAAFASAAGALSESLLAAFAAAAAAEKSGSRPGPEAIGSTWPPAACQRVSTARRAATFASAVSREASRVVAGAAAFGVSVRSEKSIIQSVDGPGCAMCPSRS